MDTKIVFLFPSKSRPEKFFGTLANITKMCMYENYEVICVLDIDDSTMNNEEVKDKIATYEKVNPYFITTTGKVDAINKGIQFLPEEAKIIILIADDIRFTLKGFDSFILEDMAKYYPSFNGCLHYPDNIAQAGERQITMPVLGIELIKELGYIYHNSYFSVFCDNEMLSVVKILGKHKYIPNFFYEHNHPAWGKGENDDLYKHNESFYQTDKDNYFKRLALNFNLC